MSATLTNRPLPDIQTRKPTGRPSWPFMLISAVEGGGKSYQAAKASASPLVGRTFWIEAGESTADEYGAIPGADYEIVPHDGSYLSILDAVRWADAQPKVDDKPNLIVFDSGSVLWEMLTDEQQLIANRRAKTKAEKYRRSGPREDEDVTITADQWNVAKDRWVTLVNILRRHDGPAIMCARLTETVVMDASGQPTKDRTWKVAGHKSLPFDAQVIIYIREPYPQGHGAGTLMKVQSVNSELNSTEQDMGPNWTVDGIWNRLGLAAGEVSQSTYVEPNAAAYEAEYDAAAAAAEQQQEQTEQTRAAADAGNLPSPDQVSQMIRHAMSQAEPEDQRRSLLQIRTSIGASNLRNVGPIKLSDGNVDANTALDKALEIVQQRRDGAPAEAAAPAATETPTETATDPEAPAADEKPAEPAAVAEAEPTPEPAVEAEAAQTKARAEAESTAPAAAPDRSKAAKAKVLEEVAYQAAAMGVAPGEWTASLSAAEGGSDVRVLAPAKIGKWLVSKRPEVIAKLREAGRDAEADAYKSKGDSPIVIVADLTAAKAAA